MPTRTRQPKTAATHNLPRQHHRLSYSSDTTYVTTTDYSVIYLLPSNTTSSKNKEKRRTTITKIACITIKEIQSLHPQSLSKLIPFIVRPTRRMVDKHEVAVIIPSFRNNFTRSNIISIFIYLRCFHCQILIHSIHKQPVMS